LVWGFGSFCSSLWGLGYVHVFGFEFVGLVLGVVVLVDCVGLVLVGGVGLVCDEVGF